MEQYNEKATVSSRLSRVFTKKRLGGLAAAVAIVLLAGGGATYYQHTQAHAAHAQERAAMSQLNAIQAEKMGVTLLSEAQIRSIAADAIGQEETAVTFDEIDLMTGEQARDLREKEHDGRAEHEKDKRKEKREPKEKEDRAEHPAQARAGAQDENMRDGKAPDGRAAQLAGAVAGDERPAPGLAPAAENGPDGSASESAPSLPPAGAVLQPQNAMRGQQSAMRVPQSGDASQDTARPRFAPGPRFTYLVHCTAGGMRYTLRIDAVSGNVFPLSVRAAR